MVSERESQTQTQTQTQTHAFEGVLKTERHAKEGTETVLWGALRNENPERDFTDKEV